MSITSETNSSITCETKSIKKSMKKDIFRQVRESLELTRYRFWKEHFEARGYTKAQIYRLDESCERIDPELHVVDLWEVSGWSGNKFMDTLKRNRKRKR